MIMVDSVPILEPAATSVTISYRHIRDVYNASKSRIAVKRTERNGIIVLVYFDFRLFFFEKPYRTFYDLRELFSTVKQIRFTVSRTFNDDSVF